MSDIPNFAKLVPGFDFLQGLVKNAGSRSEERRVGKEC